MNMLKLRGGYGIFQLGSVLVVARVKPDGTAVIIENCDQDRSKAEALLSRLCGDQLCSVCSGVNVADAQFCVDCGGDLAPRTEAYTGATQRF
jgi:hypothetical protein